MFRKGGLKDPELVLIYNTASKWEADQAKSLLEKEGIPALLMDREDSGAYLRILGYGSPFGVDVYVSLENESRAKQVIAEVFSEDNSVTDEELEELALKAKPE